MGLSPFHAGTVIPAHPLALTRSRRLDERRQRALTRYYVDSGAGGLAVGVHTTQFAIHDPSRGLLEPVLAIAAEEARATRQRTGRDITLVAGALGTTGQAVREAELAASLGYDAILLSPQRDAAEEQLIARARAVGEVLPVIGFYLQPAVGGRTLTPAFWRLFAELECVVGIKVAPFDRYRTLDVVRGVAASGRHEHISLYTGNDDHIVLDLLATYEVKVDRSQVQLRFVGGLLGQWAMWTSRAVALLADSVEATRGDDAARDRLLAIDTHLTDANGAIFDASHGFRGCIPGINEVLTRHGLLAGRWCLDEDEALSPGQFDEIDRIWTEHPTLRDDEWITSNLDRWLSG